MPNGCWNYTRGKSPDGYGKFSYGGRQLGAHRASHELFIGPIPRDENGKTLHIDHLCENPSCVRPSHLQAVTQRQNNHFKWHVRPEHYSGAAVLADLQILVPQHVPLEVQDAALKWLGLERGFLEPKDVLPPWEIKRIVESEAKRLADDACGSFIGRSRQLEPLGASHAP